MDLFAGLDGLNSSSKKPLSLAEQKQAKEASTQNQKSAFDLDLLSKSTRPAPPPVQLNRQPVAELHNTSNPEDDDIFGIFNSAPKPAQQPPASSSSTDTNEESSQTPKIPHRPASNQSFKKSTNENSNQNPPRPSQMAAQQAFSHQSAPQRHFKQDQRVARLVDMGFEVEDANRALKAMEGSVSGAVNWLMAEAQGLPLPHPKSSSTLANADFSDLQTAATQFGASVFSKASSLFSKGRKELNKMVNQYNERPSLDSSDFDLPPRPSKFRDPEPEPRLPHRPRQTAEVSREAPTRASGSSGPTAAASTSGAANGAGKRPSRAEAFRKKQMEVRNQTSFESGTVDTNTGKGNAGSSITNQGTGDLLGGDIPSASASSASTGAATGSASGAPTEEIDLLNISSSTPSTTLSATQSDLYTSSRNLGAEAFKNGDYHNAAEHYSAALDVLPNTHILRALILSNRSASLLKTGDTKTALEDTIAGLKLIPNNGVGIEVEGKQMKDIWVKLVTRQAQAAEHLEKFDTAIQALQLLLDNGHATPSILEAKRRCIRGRDIQQNKIKDPQPKEPKSKRRGWGTTGAVPQSKEGQEALAKVKAGHAKQAQEDREKELFRDKVDKKVNAWKTGHETDLRTLLSTLQNVLWESCTWTPVSTSDLVVPKKARIVYMKAVARTHPDKIASDADVETKMIAESVFVAIQQAWEVFRQENGL